MAIYHYISHRRCQKVELGGRWGSRPKWPEIEDEDGERGWGSWEWGTEPWCPVLTSYGVWGAL